MKGLSNVPEHPVKMTSLAFFIPLLFHRSSNAAFSMRFPLREQRRERREERGEKREERGEERGERREERGERREEKSHLNVLEEQHKLRYRKWMVVPLTTTPSDL